MHPRHLCATEWFWLRHAELLAAATRHLEQAAEETGNDRKLQTERLDEEVGRLAAHGIGVRCRQQPGWMAGTDETVLAGELRSWQGTPRTERILLKWRNSDTESDSSKRRRWHAEVLGGGIPDVEPLWIDTAKTGSITDVLERGAPQTTDPDPATARRTLGGLYKAAKLLSTSGAGPGTRSGETTVEDLERCAAIATTALKTTAAWHDQNHPGGLTEIAKRIHDAGAQLRLEYPWHNSNTVIAQILCIARGSKRLGWSYNKAVLMNGSGETRAGIGTEHKDNATVLKTSEYGAAVQAFLLERREPSRDADGLLRTLRSIPEHAEMRTAAAADLYTHQQREQWAVIEGYGS